MGIPRAAETALTTTTPDRDAAERLTAQIAAGLDGLADRPEAVKAKIRRALDEQAWAALDYPSPGAWITDRFGEALSRLGMEMRREVVGELAEAGFSTRAIAAVVGVGKSTVRKDQSAGARNLAPDDEADVVDGELVPDEPARVTGIDGKSYPRLIGPVSAGGQFT